MDLVGRKLGRKGGAAPMALKPKEMTPETLNAGMNAGIVPGNLGGYLSLLDRLGTMSIAEVFAPAIASTTMFWPSTSAILRVVTRPETSAAPLGVKPTTRRMGRMG